MDWAALDVDANGKTEALTDGLLIIRRLFGFEGASLVSGAISPDGERQRRRQSLHMACGHRCMSAVASFQHLPVLPRCYADRLGGLRAVCNFTSRTQ